MKFSIFKTFLLSLLMVAQVHFAYAQTASILPPAKTTFVDQNGKPLVKGTVDFYIPSTTTRKTTWQDAAETIPNANPVVLDAAGRALILGSGTYRQVVKDRNNNIIWDQNTSSVGSGGGGTSGTGDGDLVGTVKPWAGMVAPNQYLFTYGQEISRATYAVLFTAITSSQSAFCNSGSPTLSGIGDTTNFWIGMAVEVSCLAAGFSTIISKTSSSVTLAANANVTVSANAVFFPWGRGNGTTTFNLPDFRGLALAGNNNMGGTASANLNTTYFGPANPNSSGAAGGGQGQVLIASNLPAYTPSGSIVSTYTATGSDKDFFMNDTGGPISNVNTGGAGRAMSANAVAKAPTATIASTFTGTAQGGTSTAFSIVQPTKTVNYIIKVTPDSLSSVSTGVTSLGSMVGDIACGSGLICTGNNISASGGLSLASPSATIGLTVINGIALTAMRSDAAPPLSASVQSALTAPNNQVLIGTGAFGFSGTTTLPSGLTIPSPTITNGITGGGSGITFFVNASTGNDSNTCLSSGAACLTVQGAWNKAVLVNDGIGTITVSIADGTYTASGASVLAINGTWAGGAAVTIQGNCATPANVILNSTNANTIQVANASVNVTCMRLKSTTAGDSMLAYNNGIITGQTLDFNTSAGSHLTANASGQINIVGNYSITGGGVSHLHAYGRGHITLVSGTATITGTPAFSAYFAGTADASIGMGAFSFSGAATGPRYLVHDFSRIDTGGIGCNSLPGNAAGTFDTWGQCDGVFSGSGQLTSTTATGTAPFVIASTTLVPNLHVATADAAPPTVNLASRGGGFDVWQIGTSLAVVASATAYQNDGWYIITNANQASTVSQVAGIATGSVWAAKVQRNNGQTGTGVMRYAMPLDTDELVPMQGSNIALSFTAKEGANQSFSHALNYAVYCGTGAVAKRGATAFTSETAVITGTMTTTTTATRTTVTSASTFPSNCTQAEIQFNMTPSGTAGADDSFTVDDLQLEIVPLSTSTAQSYKKIDMQGQLSKAQRFQWSGTPSTSSPLLFGQAVSTVTMFGTFQFPVQMRVVPALAISAAGDFAATNAAGGLVACTSLVASVPTAFNMEFVCTVAAGLVAGNGSAIFFNNANVAKITISANI